MYLQSRFAWERPGDLERNYEYRDSQGAHGFRAKSLMRQGAAHTVPTNGNGFILGILPAASGPFGCFVQTRSASVSEVIIVAVKFRLALPINDSMTTCLPANFYDQRCPATR
jgi:hypothetical protein